MKKWFLAGLMAFAVFASRGAEVEQGPAIYNSQEETIPLLKPEEALARITLPEGFKATLFAAEPEVQQPIAMAFDTRGRLWVAENYTYAEAEKNFDTELNDRILIFEDADGDGRAESRKVFWEQAKKLTSVLPGFGGVYALCSPQLLFLPDRDGDDVPDGEPEVLLDGFNDDDIRHNLANGLKLGPDGWIYGNHGILATSWIGKPGAPQAQRVAVNVSVWRFHPVTREFEVVANGTTNPWGADWDAHGELFFINTVIGHLWHAIPGAWFRRMYGEPLNPYSYELIEQVADHVHWDTRETWSDIREGMSSSTSEAGGGHAHTALLMYGGDNWPEQYRGTMLTINFHGKRLNNDRITRAGATYTATHEADLMSIDDPYFRGIELLLGPEGGVYLADWSDIGECHDQNGVHRTSGRIYRITYGEAKRSVAQDLARLETDELVKLQWHANEWVVRKARQVLQERGARGEDLREAHGALRAAFAEEKSPVQKLRALWALYVTGGASPGFLRARLLNGNEHLRVWGIRLLVEQGAPSSEVAGRFTRMAREDESGLVLTYLASALQRIPVQARWDLGVALALRSEFEADRVFPLMVWYGMEGAVSENPSNGVALVEKSRLSKVTALATRRIFEELAESPEAAAAVVKLMAEEPFASVRLAMLENIHEALEGVRNPKAPPTWATVAPRLINSEETGVRAAALELDALFGSADSQEALARRLANRASEARGRRRALEILVRTRAEGLVPILEKLLEEKALSTEAVRALAAVGPADTPERLLGRYRELDERARREVINALASRPTYAVRLLEAVQRGAVERKEIDPTQLRQLRELQDDEVKRRIVQVWPRTDKSASSKAALFSRYQAILSERALKSASLEEGRKIYLQACGTCHKLYGEGAEIGPELTGADRRNLDYLLENIIHPSSVVPEGYRASVVTMKDERIYNGIVRARTTETVNVETVSEKVTLPMAEVESIQESELSMMPDGLLEGLEEQQVINLIGYLMSAHPLPATVRQAND